MKNEFKDKKVLLIGLGILGGGVSIANWLIKQKAEVAIFDSKPKEYFSDSIKQIKGNVKYIFENCNEEEIRNADIIVINQAVPPTNPLVMLAEKIGKPIYNESKIFYEICNKPIIAITGTRGKTTTTNWTAYLLGKKALIAGNSVEEPLLKILPKTKKTTCKVVVNEIPSFQLERFSHSPSIALITNIFVDHLNRHETLENYASIKGNIFKNQKENDKLILNYDNNWTEFYLKQNPKSEIWFFSLKTLPKDKNGIFYSNDFIYLQEKNKTPEKILNVKEFIKFWGMHNLANLISSILAAYLAGEKIINIKKKTKTLPQVKFRQERTVNNKNLEIINDTASTSPEGGIAAVERFASPYCILISGSTDAGLEYADWGKLVAKIIPIENIVLLDSSATKKMLAELTKYIDISKIPVKNTLEECIDIAFEKINELKKKNPKNKITLLFSPSGKSFEKFKNEFDRGEKFNKIIKSKKIK